MNKKNIDHYGINAKEAFRSLSLSDNIEKVLGYRGKDEIIHIDDFVLEK